MMTRHATDRPEDLVRLLRADRASLLATVGELRARVALLEAERAATRALERHDGTSDDTSMRAYQPGWLLAAMPDKAGRRGIWFRPTLDGAGRLVRLEVCGGREGDDHYAMFAVGLDAPREPCAALLAIFETGHWVLDYQGDLGGVGHGGPGAVGEPNLDDAMLARALARLTRANLHGLIQDGSTRGAPEFPDAVADRLESQINHDVAVLAQLRGALAAAPPLEEKEDGHEESSR